MTMHTIPQPGTLPHELDNTAIMRQKIFIIDDNEVDREVLAEIFSGADFSVHLADSALGAFQKICEVQPDIILLDALMPGLDGYDFCRQLHENPATAEIPVIMITSLNSVDDEQRALAAGAVDFIPKPFHVEIVKRRIVSQIQLKKSRDLLKVQAELLEITNAQLSRQIEDYKTASAKLEAANQQVEDANLVKEALIKDLFEAMCDMLSSRDHYTFEHGLRVAAIARRMGEYFGLAAQELDSLELGCLVHDISKVAIPDDVLLKPGVFDSSDRKIMEMHPEMGAKIFMRRHSDPIIIDIIQKHHERLDGSGYPNGLKAYQLNPLVRIAMVADSYEALIARRPYKRSMGREDALAVLRQEVESGKLDGPSVEALEVVTENWNPLEIGHSELGEFQKELDAFRRKTYFKEPLSDFYNYRYLFFLADKKLLHTQKSDFTLIKILFDNLDEVNEKEGYLKTDQIIDEIGTNLQNMLDQVNSCQDNGGTSILFRKGSTYLIYSNCRQELLRKLEEVIEGYLQQTREDWGLSGRSVLKVFDAHDHIDQAVYRLLDSKNSVSDAD